MKVFFLDHQQREADRDGGRQRQTETDRDREKKDGKNSFCANLSMFVLLKTCVNPVVCIFCLSLYDILCCGQILICSFL